MNQNETNSVSLLTLAEIEQTARNTIENLLPQKSKERYTNAYNKFMDWKNKNKVKSFSEIVILAYLTEMSHTHKPSTLWGIYSMLKTTLNINNNININSYQKVISFLKRQSQTFQSKKSKVLTSEEISKFLNEAPDYKYLDLKVAMTFGICGACRREELTQITINDIEDKETILLVKIPKTKNYKSRSFVISEEFYSIFKKYATLRPKDVQTSRFFLNYQNGHCTKQPIGINKFGKMPQIIASYLKLPDPQSYTGHTFRRTSATLLANSGTDIITLKRHTGWKSNTVAEGYIEDSFNNKKKVLKKICNQITCSLVNNPSSLQNSETKFNYENPKKKNSKQIKKKRYRLEIDSDSTSYSSEVTKNSPSDYSEFSDDDNSINNMIIPVQSKPENPKIGDFVLIKYEENIDDDKIEQDTTMNNDILQESDRNGMELDMPSLSHNSQSDSSILKNTSTNSTSLQISSNEINSDKIKNINDTHLGPSLVTLNDPLQNCFANRLSHSTNQNALDLTTLTPEQSFGLLVGTELNHIPEPERTRRKQAIVDILWKPM